MQSKVIISLNSQSSPCNKRLYIIGVDLQGFVIFIHGLHVAAVFEVVHTCTYTEKTKKKKKKKGYIHFNVKPEEAKGRQTR